MLSEHLDKHEFCPRGVYEIIRTFQKTHFLHYKNETFNAVNLMFIGPTSS
jgi:hypothetical protein